MIKKHLLTSDEKLQHWGYGEWVEEPDVIEFEHENFKCKVQRIFFPELNGHLFGGYLCGYICIPEDHPWRIINWNDEYPADIHGGVTYYALEEDGFWIGLDCAHLGDLIPSNEALKKKLYELDPIFRKLKDQQREFQERLPKSILTSHIYRNVDYVIQQCKALVDQASFLKKK